MSILKTIALLPLLLMVAACEATYFKITDPATGNEYYTVDYTHAGDAIRFQDAKTGATRTVQNPRVLDIDHKAFEAGVAASAAK